MPATYSFSLNLRKDRDIIDLMESARNKSFLIRKALHSINRVEVLELYIERLEKLVTTSFNELEWSKPSFTQMINRCYEVKEERLLDLKHVPQEVHNSFQEQE